VVTRCLSSAACGWLLLNLAASAQGPPPAADTPLSLEDCVRKAVAVPSPVSLARRDREIADRGVGIARAGFLPGSAATAGYVYNSPWQQDRSLMSFVALNGIREFAGLATVFQEIDTSGRLRAEYARARAQQTLAGASLAIAERDLRRAVGAAYYRLLLARHLADAFRDVLAESEAFERRARLLAAAGEAARADVVKASSQTAFLRQALLSAELAAKLANQDLAGFWTQAVDEPLKIVDSFDDPLPDPEPSAAEPAPYLKRFEFRFLDAQRQVFTSQAKAAKAAILPRLSWSFQYGLDVNKVAWNNRGYAAIASLQVPIFDWFRARDTARQFRLQAEQVIESRAISERRFSQEYRSALERVKQFFAQVAVSRSQTELAAEDLNLSRVRYEGGEGAAVDVVVAQNQLAQAKSNYYTSIANYMNARLDLEVAAGR
jgi:outer membrane protein